MGDAFNIPAFSSSTTSVRPTHAMPEIRGGVLLLSCKCNQRNGLQQECRKCRSIGTGKRYQQQEREPPALMHQSQPMPMSEPEPYTIKEGELIDGSDQVYMKDGTPLDTQNVSYIDYGMPVSQFMNEGQRGNWQQQQHLQAQMQHAQSSQKSKEDSQPEKEQVQQMQQQYPMQQYPMQGYPMAGQQGGDMGQMMQGYYQQGQPGMMQGMPQGWSYPQQQVMQGGQMQSSPVPSQN